MPAWPQCQAALVLRGVVVEGLAQSAEDFGGGFQQRPELGFAGFVDFGAQ